jgi:putative ABC transport system permease protein
MTIPVAYNLLSARRRWTSSVAAVFGIAGTVAVFVSMLGLARGFRSAVVSSGLPENVIVRRMGADSEVTSILEIADVRLVEDAPQVAREGGRALVSPEVVVIAALPLRATGTDANVQVRGVSPRALSVRHNVRVAEGRFLTPGLPEIVVGRGALNAYTGLELGATVPIGAGRWKVVGILDAGGSAFDSEVWADANVLNAFYQRPPGVYQSATARLLSSDAFGAFEAALAADPRLRLSAMREPDYYARQSETVTMLITVLGGLVAAVMAVGAVFAALNTMYSSVADRAREVAVLRAVGFGSGGIALAFLIEAAAVSAVGGMIGCLAALPVNGITTGTINWQTFSHLAFAFRITPDLMVAGIAFGVAMGVAGGLPPAIHAARAPVAAALRAL